MKNEVDRLKLFDIYRKYEFILEHIEPNNIALLSDIIGTLSIFQLLKNYRREVIIKSIKIHMEELAEPIREGFYTPPYMALMGDAEECIKSKYLAQERLYIALVKKVKKYFTVTWPWNLEDKLFDKLEYHHDFNIKKYKIMANEQ